MPAVAPQITPDQVDSKFLIEAIAALDAVYSATSALNGGTETPLAGYFQEIAWSLKDEAFGSGPEDDDEYARDPLRVEIEARADEHAADALQALLGEDEISVSVERHRRHAKNVRAAGTINVDFLKDER